MSSRIRQNLKSINHPLLYLVQARALPALLCLPLLSFAPFALGDSVTLEPFKDNTVYSENDNSNGAFSHLFVGRRSRASDARRALLAFDLSESIPQGATIDSASLTVRVSRTSSGPANVDVHRLTKDWGEGSSDSRGQGGAGTSPASGDATWNNAFSGGDAWQSEGGDFAAEASAGTSVGANNTSATWSSEALVADLQSWVDDPGSNFGWILIGPEDAKSAKRINSREGSSDVPQLVIDFTPGSGGGGEPVNPFATLEDLGGGWRESPWFGVLNDTTFPWIFHLQHEFVFVFFRETENDFFLFDLSTMDWWFTSETLYPNVFNFNRNSWIFYFAETAGPRQFVDLQSGEFFNQP